MFTIMADIKIPNAVPKNWITFTNNLTHHTPMDTRYDVEDPATKISLENRETIVIYTEQLIKTIKENIFPHHKI